MAVSLPERTTSPGSLRRQVTQNPTSKGFRVEIIRGRIVMSPTPSFKHGGVVHRIEAQLRSQMGNDRIARQMFSIAAPVDQDNYCTPDLVVVPSEVEEEDDWLLEADTVDLTVEVLSPGNTPSDVLAKLEEYAEWNIPVYLFVDPGAGEILLYSDPADGKYRTVHEARFGETVRLPGPLAGIDVDTADFPRYAERGRR